VPDMKMEGIENINADPAGFYIPIAQSGVGNRVSMVIRTRGAPMAITPDVQLVVNPALDPSKESLWIFGLRVRATL